MLSLFDLFERPLWSDPLWWFGLVGGAAGGVWGIVDKDLTGAEAVLMFLGSVIGFTFWVAGLVGGSIRAIIRRRRQQRRPDLGGTVPAAEQSPGRP